jgi:flagellum-specific peptidoglycan hydrolase FlgJ
MNAGGTQRWQQATALVSLSTVGAMTGVAFAHGTLADMTTPTSMPAHLLAFKKAARPASAGDDALRAAIVSAAKHYLRLAQGKTPAEMEALIWQHDSIDGADHGESCAAFASLTLEAGAQATGQQSWVTGGTSYPWPLYQWADVRVDPNPQSPGIISIVQDAEAHNRWHPLGDGYTPQPGDWVLFSGHVEVVTQYSGGALYTIGGDSRPNLSVNAHQYSAPLADQGVAGFVNNGQLLSAVSPATATSTTAAPAQQAAPAASAGPGQADVPGMVAPGGPGVTAEVARGLSSGPAPAVQTVLLGAAAIPGAQSNTGGSAAAATHRYSRHPVPASLPQASGTAAQQDFIAEIAPGAMAAQRQYGIPAAVTIAQAIDESGWGQSELATQDHNLFGIKGTGPAGSVLMPTQEYENGTWVTINAPFRMYNSVAESINDHTLLLATGSSYKQAMADRSDPDAFANDLTGVYATDPNYGNSLITTMRLYNLYRYDAGSQSAPHAAVPAGRPGPAAASSDGQNAAGADAGIPGAEPQLAVGYGSAGGGLGTSAAGGGSAPGGQAGVAIQSARQRSGRNSEAKHGGVGPSRGEARLVPQSSVGAGTALRSRTTSTTARAAQPRVTGGSRPSAAAGRAGLATAATGTAQSGTARSGTARSGTVSPGASRPGSVVGVAPGPGASQLGGARIPGAPSGNPGLSSQPGAGPTVKAGPPNARISTKRYVPQIPQAVTMAFIATAKTPLLRSAPLYREVASQTGVRWQLLAACDWMQCRAQPRLSPVYGEKLGTTNPDGTVYQTKSAALEQCARDLIILAGAVYGIELRQPLHLSVRDLAKVFAAFRWGGLLAAHYISALEFPYSVEGLTARHIKMRWPHVPDAPGPDRPGTRFRMPFGAVPVVLGLDYRAVA